MNITDKNYRRFINDGTPWQEIFEVDYDTQDARFHEGYIYDTDSNEWSRVSIGELDDDDSEYCKAADALHDALRMIEWRTKV